MRRSEAFARGQSQRGACAKGISCKPIFPLGRVGDGASRLLMHMNHLQAFRFSICGSLICFLISFVLPYADTALYSEATIDLLQENGYLSIVSLPPAISFIFLIVWVALARGMWVFHSRARTAYLGMMILTTLLTPFEGFRVESPIEALCLDIALMFDGAVMALAYFSPVKNEFSTTPAA